MSPSTQLGQSPVGRTQLSTRSVLSPRVVTYPFSTSTVELPIAATSLSHKTVTRSINPVVDFNGTPCWPINGEKPDVCTNAKGEVYENVADQAIEMKVETEHLAKEDHGHWTNLLNGPVELSEDGQER